LTLRRDRRTGAEVLAQLDALLRTMNDLGIQGHDATDRITAAIRAPETTIHPALMDALSDVLHVVAERTKLASEAHRLLVQMRAREQQRLDTNQ